MIARRRIDQRALVVAACLLAASFAGCGDDDEPNGPTETNIVRFPEDAATMSAALEAASIGDTILVSPGEHMIDSMIVFGDGHTGVTIMGRSESQMGMGGAARPTLRFAPMNSAGILVPANALGITIRGLRLTGDVYYGVQFSGPGGRVVDCEIDSITYSAVRCTNPATDAIIEANILREAGAFGVQIGESSHPLVIGNTIIGSKDCGIYHYGAATCERNIIVESVNYGIFCGGAQPPVLSCNAFFANGVHYSDNCDPGVTDIQADPMFCNTQTLALFAESPCAAENAGECGQIGAVGVGCAVDTVAARPSP